MYSEWYRSVVKLLTQRYTRLQPAWQMNLNISQISNLKLVSCKTSVSTGSGLVVMSEPLDESYFLDSGSKLTSCNSLLSEIARRFLNDKLFDQSNVKKCVLADNRYFILRAFSDEQSVSNTVRSNLIEWRFGSRYRDPSLFYISLSAHFGTKTSSLHFS